MKKLITYIICLLLIFPLCACALSRAEEIPFEEMHAVFQEYEGMYIEDIAAALDKSDTLYGQIPYRGSSFVQAPGGNVLLGNIGEYFGIIEITWTGYNSFPIECIRGIMPGMTREKVEQHLFCGSTPFWTELPDAVESDPLRSTFLLISCGSLHGRPMRIELYFFFTADTLTAIKLSVCPESEQ